MWTVLRNGFVSEKTQIETILHQKVRSGMQPEATKSF